MNLIDSTAWVEYYRPGGAEVYAAWASDAIEADTASINAIILAEILAFTKTRSQYELVTSDSSAFHWLDMGSEVAVRAAELGYALRRMGLTISATDLLICAYAETAGASLVHNDGHFLDIARVSAIPMQTTLS
jgi:predicted nucleic acid-binding protein